MPKSKLEKLKQESRQIGYSFTKIRPISTDAFLQRSSEKFATTHAQKEKSREKSVRASKNSLEK